MDFFLPLNCKKIAFFKLAINVLRQSMPFEWLPEALRLIWLDRLQNQEVRFIQFNRDIEGICPT